MSKIFFDTNILLDILIKERENHDKAVKVLIDTGENYAQLVTSENILTTLEYVAKKNKVSCEKIAKFFEMIQNNFHILNFSHIIKDGTSLYVEHCQNGQKIDFEDALQLLCAINDNCDIFITEDKGIAKLDVNIKVMNLKDF